jgi:hypothetical protein
MKNLIIGASRGIELLMDEVASNQQLILANTPQKL